MIKKIFKYIEPLWLGEKDQISIRRVLAIAFSIDFITSEFYAVRNWDASKSLGELSSILMIEAGLIAALLTLTTWQNMNNANNRSNANRQHNIIKDLPDAPVTGNGGEGSLSE